MTFGSRDIKTYSRQAAHNTFLLVCAHVTDIEYTPQKCILNAYRNVYTISDNFARLLFHPNIINTYLF